MSYVQDILAMDKELTAFKHVVLETPNRMVADIVDDFPFKLANLDKPGVRERLVNIGRDARRYPHRVPKQ